MNMDNSATFDERLSDSTWSLRSSQLLSLWLQASANQGRIVDIHRDERGFGFVVAGDKPVFVQTVREGGAAERAGIVKGDVIVKVNGIWVTNSNHAEVVELIRAGGSCVSLTVVSPPSGIPTASNGSPNLSMMNGPGTPPPPPPPPPHAGSGSRGLQHQPSRVVTAPQPIGHEQQRYMEHQRLNTIRLMLEKEQQFVEAKRSDLARGYSPTVAAELAGAEKRVRELLKKVEQMTAALGMPFSESQPQLSSPPVERPHPYKSSRWDSASSRTSFRLGAAEGGGWDNLACDVPPPLPARNRTLVSQASAPSLTSPSMEQVPPPLPPRNPSIASSSSSSSCSSSSSSARSPNNPATMPDVLPTGNNDGWAQTNPVALSSGAPGPSPMPSHHRTKSSPFPFTAPNVSPGVPDTRRFSSSDSISELDLSKRGQSLETVESPGRATPPGTPPPPYRCPLAAEDAAARRLEVQGTPLVDQLVMTTSMLSETNQSPGTGALYTGQDTQLGIISMEDDDFSDHEIGHVADHGIFNTLAKLWQHNAHLAVFMNFVLSSSDPAGLFFHLITDLYKEGTAKDMKRWAYEIHSTFLVPNAPLKINNVDEHILHEIDDALQADIDKEEILRKVFWKARAKAKEELKEQLLDFQNKRAAGLGSIYGPPDAQLEESLHDKNKELKIIEGILVPRLDTYSDDLENAVDRTLAIASCLATILQKIFVVKSAHAVALTEKCPTFVAKEKSLKSKILSKNKKQLHSAKGHNFMPHQYFSVTVCNHCGNVLWGVSPQGYQCTNCEMNIHKGCIRVLEESCIGALRRNNRGNDRFSKIIRDLRKKPTPQERVRRGDDMGDISELDTSQGDKQPGTTLPASAAPNGKANEGRDRRSGPGSGSDSFGESDRRPSYLGQQQHSNTPPNEEEVDHSVPVSAAHKKIVSRSESLRERAQRKHHREKRKHSDPNLPPSHSSDVDLDGRSISCNNSGSSSNSSLSTSLESPSPLDMVSASRVSASGLSDGSSGISVSFSATPSGHNGIAPWDSDVEADPDPPDWTRNLDADVLDRMPSKEKQRQEVINELFHTERNYVRNLKVLDRIFYRPLVENGLLPAELLCLLFPNLPEILRIHSHFNDLMKARKKEQPVVQDIADILATMFDNASGENFQQAAASFCKNQSVALEALRERRKKDTKLQAFLTEAEGNSVCRRLQLKDIIPTTMQRLTKYPLLLESLSKYTAPRTAEAAAVKRALERAKEILNFVNQAVKEAENYHRVVEIQKRLDKSAFDKADHPLASELKNLDLTKHRLVYEGSLTWRIKGQKSVDLQVVVLEEFILLLQKQDEKYVLKFHNVSYMSGKEDTKFTHSPIIKLGTVLVRPVATDKLAFFLVNTSPSGAQIYDLVAMSISERKAWFRHITDATEAYKTREGRNRRPDLAAAAPAPTLTTSSSAAQLASCAETPEKIKEDVLEDPTCHEAAAGITATSSEAAAASPAPPSSAASTVPEPSVSSSAERQEPQEPPAAPASAAAQAEASKKGESGSPTPSRNDTAGNAATTTTSPAPQRRLQRVEILKIAEGTPLIDPAEVVVSQGAVLTAEPVLTPLEKLRRKDQVIRTALADKQRIVADILHVPQADLEALAESVNDGAGEKEAKLLIWAALTQASRLATVLNETLRLSEEEAIAAVSDPSAVLTAPAGSAATSPRLSRKTSRMPGVPTAKLLPISAALNEDLTHLLGVITQRDEERDQLRRELQKARDQISDLLQTRPLSMASLTDNSESILEAQQQAVEAAAAQEDPLCVEEASGMAAQGHSENAIQQEECMEKLSSDSVSDGTASLVLDCPPQTSEA